MKNTTPKKRRVAVRKKGRARRKVSKTRVLMLALAVVIVAVAVTTLVLFLKWKNKPAAEVPPTIDKIVFAQAQGEELTKESSSDNFNETTTETQSGTEEADTEKESETVSESSSEKETGSEGESVSEKESTNVVATDSSTLRIDYVEGFFYEPLSQDIKDRITGISYPAQNSQVPYEDLRYMQVKYVDFSGNTATGELICNKAVAQDFVEIFYELYTSGYQIEKIKLIDEYQADDRASMGDNNTSAFNYRIVSGTTHLSQHAYGTAIDVNPFYNPYCEGNDYVSPPGSEAYADRSADFAHKIDENDLCYKLFTDRGFAWGGAWNSCKDYQHFQKKLK